MIDYRIEKNIAQKIIIKKTGDAGWIKAANQALASFFRNNSTSLVQNVSAFLHSRAPMRNLFFGVATDDLLHLKPLKNALYSQRSLSQLY